MHFTFIFSETTYGLKVTAASWTCYRLCY